jgi:H+/Na+-translocating ferredoxin:NAD+ oxidoreductase subunit G
MITTSARFVLKAASGLTFLWMLVTNVAAERYLTVAEAQKLCFPQAERFDSRTILLMEEQAKAVAKRSGVKVRNLGNRVWFARQGTNLIGVLFVDHVLGKHELIDYAVAISPEGKVMQIEVLEYRESYGHEIRGARWRAQFKGKTIAAKLQLNGDIYNISGATISCRNVTEGVKRVLATYELVVRPQLVAAGVLSDADAAHRR